LGGKKAGGRRPAEQPHSFKNPKPDYRLSQEKPPIVALTCETGQKVEEDTRDMGRGNKNDLHEHCPNTENTTSAYRWKWGDKKSRRSESERHYCKSDRLKRGKTPACVSRKTAIRAADAQERQRKKARRRRERGSSSGKNRRLPRIGRGAMRFPRHRSTREEARQPSVGAAVKTPPTAPAQVESPDA